MDSSTVNNPYNEKLILLDDKKYNSAGVLLINRYSNKDCVVLFKSALPIPSGINKGKFYCDIPGGGIDIKDDTLEQTASRELFEETKKLLDISPNKLKFIKDKDSFLELPGRRLSGKRKAGLFACYVTKLPHINSKIYNNNKEILKKIKIDKVFYETIELIRIPNANLKEYFKDKKISEIKKQIEVKDINDNLQFITVLASKCIYLAINKILNEKSLIDNPEKLTDYKEITNDLKDEKLKGMTIKYS
jgi:8-oxo-dGTP pyrophosphatase MutT (NUDIX family)